MLDERGGLFSADQAAAEDDRHVGVRPVEVLERTGADVDLEPIVGEESGEVALTRRDHEHLCPLCLHGGMIPEDAAF